jgi:NAD(P)-dependent dehydrogenase (short-subunit alcohol dehydrogenase family)
VFLTTGVAQNPRAYWGMYGASKAGMENLVMTWAAEVEATPVRVNLVDPGRTATKLRAAAYPGEDPDSIAQPADVAPGIAALCLPSETHHGARIRLGG